MDNIDYYFVVPAAAAIAWQLYGILFLSPKIIHKGRPAGTTGSKVMFGVLIAIGLIDTADIAKLSIIYVCALVLFGLHGFVIRSGIGSEGLYWGSLKIPYRDLEYYQDIRDFQGGFSLRFHTRAGKDYVVLYKEEQRAALTELLTAHKIRDYDTFRFFDQE